jgi:hypothetical protein
MFLFFRRRKRRIGGLTPFVFAWIGRSPAIEFP